MAGLLGLAPAAPAVDPEAAGQYAGEIRPALMRYCGECHRKDKSVNFLTVTNLADINTKRGAFRSAVSQLRNRTMPPADEDQPTEAQRMEISNWLEKVLRQTAGEMGPYAGANTARRLNRLEYDNTIRDLLGLELNFSESFPTDSGGGEGFNNNGETLYLPVILMERYLEAAQLILDNAIVQPPLTVRFKPEEILLVTEDGAAKAQSSLAKGQEVSVSAGIYVKGDYVLKVSVAAKSGAAPLVLKVDGIPAKRFTAQSGGGKTEEVAVHLPRGVHTFALRCEDGAAQITQLELVEKPREVSAAKRGAHARIFGKVDTTALADKPAAAKRGAAKEALAQFTRLAFRRPVPADELDRFMTLYDRAAERGDPFEESVKLSLKGVLVSPHFLFRVEQERPEPGVFPVNDYELASRLSYFLWNSMPDAELMRLADEGNLNDPAMLTAQMKRMLADRKAGSFVEDFTGQWLGTKEVGASVAFTGDKFKGLYTSELAAELREEPVRLLQFVLRENRNLLELINGDYTFVTERMAKHYGLDGISGGEFRKVSITDGRRGGLLGLAAVHMITASPERTSPVLRGAWVMDTLLGTPVPPPPPGVPPLEDISKKKKNAAQREQLEEHRANPTCAACHDVIDPVGFGLENFDVLGRWRDKDKNKAIDASGVMASGEKFNGFGELKQIMLNRKREFARQITSKMLGYALGRSLEDRDDGTIEKIVSALEQNGYESQVLLREVVLSTPFRNRQGGEAPVKAEAPKRKPLTVPSASAVKPGAKKVQ